MTKRTRSFDVIQNSKVSNLSNKLVRRALFAGILSDKQLARPWGRLRRANALADNQTVLANLQFLTVVGCDDMKFFTDRNVRRSVAVDAPEMESPFSVKAL